MGIGTDPEALVVIGLDGGEVLGGNLSKFGVVVRVGGHELGAARYSSARKLYFSNTFRSTYSAET